MRVWTNGALHVARFPRGLYILRGTQVMRFLPLPYDENQQALLAVDPSGSQAWIEGFRRVSLEDGTIDEGQGSSPLDLASSQEGLVALLAEGSSVRLVTGDPRVRWSRTMNLLPCYPVRIRFPSSVGASSAWVWNESGHLCSKFLRLRVAPSGIAVICRQSGLIGVIRGEESPRWFQAPSGEGGLLDALPTSSGLLISLRIGEEGISAHFAEDGHCEGHTGVILRSIGATLLAGERFVIFDGAKGRLKVCSTENCQDLHPRSRLSLPAPPLDAASSPDGRWVIFGDATTLSIFELGDKRLSLVASLVPEQVLRETEAKQREKQRIEQGGHYRRPEGPPSLGFPAFKAPTPSWEAVLGAPLELALSLRSTGGAGQGVAVEISGPALEQALVQPLSVEICGRPLSLSQQGTKWAGTRADIEIPQGITFPFDPKPKTPEQLEKAQSLLAATHLPFQVRLATCRAGSAMLSVAAWPLQGTAAPMKWTRLLSVREG
ncbi:MAG: hypothetical protein RMJ98_09910 [Myxococcales bacterium]|nr:hypothetical protein [Polyangiaceae bacterium]MDW8249604.1 hypothetical protein [Myxococcales bacterium]